MQNKSKTNKAQKVLYFAYGSNMVAGRLAARVGPVKCLGPYILPGYKLTFDTGSNICSYANVEEVEGETCEGVVFEMTYAQLVLLDWYEGLYERVKETFNGRRLHVYIANRWRNKNREPEITEYYHNLLRKGCLEHNLRKSLALVNAIKPMDLRTERFRNASYAEAWD